MRRSLLLIKPSKQAALRILCFPYAGGTSAFTYNWRADLPEHVELLGVRYPGRETRFTEPLLSTPQEIVEFIWDDILTCVDRPMIFFGYSLGTLIAYETSKLLFHRGVPGPAHLIVAAGGAPHIPRKRAPVSDLPEEELIAKLRSYGGTPESILRDRDFLGYFLPALRADFATAERYRYSPWPPLPCPITAIGGDMDETVEESSMTAWDVHTSSVFDFQRLAGGHFFLHERREALVSLILEVAAHT